MPLLVRIDVDRPYGRSPFFRHVLSRTSSDLCTPTLHRFGYLKELRSILELVKAEGARTYVFFRRCTLPSPQVLELLDTGGHEIGLHLEDSRTFSTFQVERQLLETRVGRSMKCFSKHGSGGAKFGFHHHAPYEPQRYIEWAQRADMKLFLGNLEDPTALPFTAGESLTVFPAAFWLEPSWRDTSRFCTDWLLDHARHRDIVMLIHPENVLASAELTLTFKRIISKLESKILP